MVARRIGGIDISGRLRPEPKQQRTKETPRTCLDDQIRLPAAAQRHGCTAAFDRARICAGKKCGCTDLRKRLNRPRRARDRFGIGSQQSRREPVGHDDQRTKHRDGNRLADRSIVSAHGGRDIGDQQICQHAERQRVLPRVEERSPRNQNLCYDDGACSESGDQRAGTRAHFTCIAEATTSRICARLISPSTPLMIFPARSTRIDVGRPSAA